ncbi:MAG: autotransporter-associated beta strand repeat-containing protein [Lentisphaeraceae bacterium]|nr:autotransporter-associated beta strand repeat-containing protein [Lentisphaeraceae bacterium]
MVGTLTGDGALTVASGVTTLSGQATYTGLTTVQGGATLSAASLAGSLICEAGAILKPRAIGTPLALDGTLTATNLAIDLSAFAERPDTIPLITSPSTLTQEMVSTTDFYRPVVEQLEDGTWKLSYTYRFANTALTWEGGASGDLADAVWGAEGVHNISLRTNNAMIFPENGSYTLTNNTSALASLNGALTVGANTTLSLTSTTASTLAGNVTLGESATLTLGGACSATGSITGTSATLSLDVQALANPSEISVGTLKLTGSTLPSGEPRGNFSCSTLVFSEELVAAIEAATNQEGTVLTLASAYTGSVVPTCTTLPTGYALKVVENALVVAFTAPVVTELYAQVSGTGNWTALTWCSDEACTSTLSAVIWSKVTAVTLTATAEATVTLDLALTSLTSLTVTSSTFPLTLTGESLSACTFSTFCINGPLTLDGAVITTIPANLSGTGTLTFKHAAVSSTRGDNGSNFAYNDFTGRWVVEREATLTLAATATENRKGLLNWDNTVADSGQIEVRAGGTLAVNQKNAFGWDDVSAQKEHTVLVVDGGTVTIGTNEQHFRRKMEWHPGSVLDNQGTQFYLTRGVTMNVVAGESTAPVIFRGNAIKLKGDNACSGNANTAFVVAAGAVLQVDAAIVQSNTNDALTLSGVGTVLLNGANTHTQATTVAAGTTIGGTGSITSSAVTLNGSKILANADGNALTLSMVSGSADIVVPEGFPETTTAVLKTNSASAPTLTPPTGYVRSEATANGIKTVYLEWMPYDSLTADVSGTVALSTLSWETPEGTAVASPDWRFVTAVTFKGLTADATVTMDDDLAATVTTLTGAGQTVTLAGETAWTAGTRTFAGNLALSRALASGTLSVATGATLTLSADNSAFTGTLNLATGATLRATSPEAIAFATSTSGDYTGLVLDNSALKLTGAGTLELAFSDAKNTFNLLKFGTSYFSGGFLVTSGTLKLPGGAAADGPMKNRTITVRGANAKLATGSTKDATGWSVVENNQKLILEEGGSYELLKRDTFKTPLEMTGGIVRLMYHTGVDGSCALQIFNGQKTTVKAVNGATSASPTISKLTLEASSNPGDWRKAKITNDNWQVTVEENAQFYIDAILSSDGDHGFIKSGAGEMVLAAENVYTGVTTINAGTLRVTGTTGRGATTIKQNAVLCGTGTVKGTLTFEAGAIFAADPAASLTVTGAVTAGGTVTVRLASVPTETVALLTAASLPAVSAFSAENLPEDFALVVVGNTLYAEKLTVPSLVQATVNGAAAWESLSWQTMAGTALSGTIDWVTVEAVTLHISEDATLSGVPALKANGQLVLDFTAATEKTLTLEATESRTLPAVTIAGTVGGNLLADSTTFTLTSLAAASSCPYLGTSPELLGTLTASPITFSENALIGLLCSADGSSLPAGKILKAPQQGFAIRTGTFQPVQGDTFGDNSVNTKIRVDAGAALDVNGHATTCVLTLNGGTLTNTGNGVGSNSRQLANITLTADSVIDTSKEINSIDHYYAVQTLTLNGHTLTKRGSATFGLHNASIASDGGRIVVEGGTLQFYDNGTKPNFISGTVTFENKGGTLTLSDAYTVAADSTLTFKGNVTVTGALTVGSNTGVTIAYDGDVVPTSSLASLDTCAQVTFSDTFWKAVKTKTVATGTVFTLATSYGSSTAPTFTAKTGYALKAQETTTEGAETTTLILTYSGAISDVTAVQATVSGDANWSALVWKDMDGNAVTPTWGKVTSVTLTAEAEATVTVDLPIATVTTLRVTGTGPLTLAAGTTAGFPTGTLTLTNADLTMRDLYAPAAAVTVSGTGSLTWELTRGVAHTGAITTPSTVDFKTQGDMTLSSTSNYFRGSFSVLSGETVLSCGSQGGGEGATRGLEGDVTIAQGATLRLKSGDAFDYSLSTSSPQQINVLGTLAIDAKATLLPVNTLLLGEGAQVTSSLDPLALDFYGANVPIKVTGPGAVIDAKIGAHDANKSATATFSQGASLELRSALNSTSFSLTTALADAASEGTLILTGAQSGTGTLTVGDGVILAGSGSWGDAVTFEAGAKLLVDPAAEAPLTLNGAIRDKAQVVLASAPTEPSTAALQTTAESGSLSTTNFTAPDGYKMTLSEDSKTLYVATAKNVYASLVGQISTDGMWSAISWTKEDWLTEATDIDWNYVEEVTLFSGASAIITVDVPLPSLTKVTTSAMEASVLLTLECDAALATEPFSALTEVDVGGSVAFAAKTVAAMPATVDHKSASTAQVIFADNFATATGAKVTLSNCTVVFNGTNTFTAPVTVKKGTTLAGSGSLAADVTFEAGSAVLADGAALRVGTVTVANGATVTVTPAAGLADATVLVAANALTESNFTEPTGYTRTVVEGTTLKLSRNLTLEVKYQDEALETVLSDAAKQRIREQVCKVAGTAVTGTIATKIEVLHADGATVKAVDTSALEGLLTCFKNHTAATVEGTTATVKVCYDFGVSHITVDADRAVIVTAKVEGQSAEVDFAEGVSFSVVDMNTDKVWSMATGDLLEQTTGEMRFKIPADRLDDANSKKLLEDFIGTRALRVKVTRQESR